MKTSRLYSSPLRAEQAAATRSRVVDAAVELLQMGDAAAVSMQDVAERAGVSVRTVHRLFPTKDDLLDGVLATLQERFLATAGQPPRTKEELQHSVPDAVRAVYELEPHYRALFATAAGREAHRSTAHERRAHVTSVFADEIDGLSPDQGELFAALMLLVTSSRGVLFLKEYAGLDVDAATAAVSWAVTVLTAAVENAELRAQLGQVRNG